MRIHFPVTLILAVLAATSISANVTGVVITSDGEAVANCEVRVFLPESSEVRLARLTSSNPKREPLARVLTNAKGTFSIDVSKGSVAEIQFEAAGLEQAKVLAIANDELGVIALRPLKEIGASVSAAGKPVKDAVVVWTSAGIDKVTKSDAQGKFSIPDPAISQATLRIVHASFAPLTQIFGRERKSLAFRLTPGVVLKGKVLATDGKTPVAGAPIYLDGWPAGVSGENGAFEVPHAPTNWLRIEAFTKDQVAGVTRKGAGPVTLKLAQGSSLSGSVRDGKTKAPLPGAVVTLLSSTGQQVVSVVADAKGAFVMKPILSGAYGLSASYPWFFIPARDVTLETRKRVDEELTGKKMATLSGAVIGENKEGIAAASLYNRRANEDPFPFDRTAGYSGPDGKFLIRVPPADEERRLEAIKKGFPSGRSERLRVLTGEQRSGLIITIPAGVLISGKVVDSEGKPVPGVTIASSESDQNSIMRIRRLSFTSPETLPTTAADGSFSLRLKPGKYDFSFNKPEFLTHRMRAYSAMNRPQPIKVILERGVEVSGRVVRSDGTGVADVSIDAGGGPSDSASAETGPDGSFVLNGLSPGSVSLRASKPGELVEQVRTVRAPAKDIVIQMPTGGVIEGRVVDRESKQPITAFSVSIGPPQPGGGGFYQRAQDERDDHRSEDGRFSLTALENGAFELTVSAAGYVNERVAVTVDEKKPVRDLEVALERGRRVKGKVTDADGSPLADVLVRQSTQAAGGFTIMGSGMMMGPSQVVTNEQGDYDIAGMRAGETQLQFTKRGYLPERKPVTITGTEARLDVRLSAGKTVTGEVISEDGTPVEDAQVFTRSAAAGGSGGSSRTDHQGRFDIVGLASGRYTFSATKSGFVMGLVKDVDVDTSPAVRITLTKGGAVFGAISGVSPREMPLVIVLAVSDGKTALAAVDSSGNYRVEGVAPGSVRIIADRSNTEGRSSTEPVTVELTAGGEVQANLEFKTGIVIRGRVTRGGQPAQSSSVQFIGSDVRARVQGSASTDPSGTYEISGLAPGKYSVIVFDRQRMTRFETTYEVRATDTFDIDIKATSVRGRVIEAESGEPLREVRVRLEQKTQTGPGPLMPLSAATDGNGSFLIDGLSPGTYRVRAEKEKYSHQISEILITEGAEQQIELKLSRTEGVSLLVVDARDGRPLQSWIRAIDGQQQTAFDGFSSPGTDGALSIPLPPGQYQLTVRTSGYAPQMVQVNSPSPRVRVALTPGGTIVIRSTSARTVVVKLVGAEGQPPVRGWRGSGEFPLDPGNTTLENVTPGAYSLQLLDDAGKVMRTLPLTVIDGRTINVEL